MTYWHNYKLNKNRCLKSYLANPGRLKGYVLPVIETHYYIWKLQVIYLS